MWLYEYNIGHDTVDQQHQYLFYLANRIVNPYNDQQTTHHNVVALYQYVREHFRDEELLMKQCLYPGYEIHVKQHDSLTRRLDKISCGILTDETSTEEVCQFMNNWLLVHILGEDMQFGNFLNATN